jgi:hypothetical protein
MSFFPTSGSRPADRLDRSTLKKGGVSAIASSAPIRFRAPRRAKGLPALVARMRPSMPRSKSAKPGTMSDGPIREPARRRLSSDERAAIAKVQWLHLAVTSSSILHNLHARRGDELVQSTRICGRVARRFKRYRSRVPAHVRKSSLFQ